MEGLALLGTRRKHAVVLQHLLGYLKKDLSGGDQQELLELIGDYRHELAPLSVPLGLLKHHLRRHAVPEWMDQQVYLSPYAPDLMLRKHVHSGVRDSGCSCPHNS